MKPVQGITATGTNMDIDQIRYLNIVETLIIWMWPCYNYRHHRRRHSGYGNGGYEIEDDEDFPYCVGNGGIIYEVNLMNGSIMDAGYSPFYISLFQNKPHLVKNGCRSASA